MDNQFEQVVLITGSGAVENAWKPIIRILEPDYKFEFDIDSSNSFLALLVYQLRTVALENTPQSKEHLEIMKRDYNLIKQELCRSLMFAQTHNEIFIRKQFYHILDKFIFQKHIKFVHITTNWDSVVDNAINYYGHSTEGGKIGKIKTFHIHGSAESPNGLYLPSEITKEPYRSDDESIEMKKNHSLALNTISACNRTILYGLSLDPLDAELSQILAMGWNSESIKEIIVINPDCKKVMKRVKLLFSNYNDREIEICGYLPNDLETKLTI